MSARSIQVLFLDDEPRIAAMAARALCSRGITGIYAWPGPNALTTYIVRDDGHSTQVASDGKTYSQIAAYVSNTEYWSIESKVPNGPSGVAFTKIQLGSW